MVRHVLSYRRFLVGLAIGLALCVAAAIVALATPSKPGSGRIYFAHAVDRANLHLIQPGRVISTSQKGFAFKASLNRSSFIPVRSGWEVMAVFQRWTHSHRWQPVWKLSAIVPSASDNILAKNYKLRFIERKGVTPFGYYRMIIFGRHHKWLAHGRFWLVR